ncbi:MAG: hypothetical protein R3A52_13645 [Polyangiales bacterium]
MTPERLREIVRDDARYTLRATASLRGALWLWALGVFFVSVLVAMLGLTPSHAVTVASVALSLGAWAWIARLAFVGGAPRPLALTAWISGAVVVPGFVVATVPGLRADVLGALCLTSILVVAEFVKDPEVWSAETAERWRRRVTVGLRVALLAGCALLAVAGGRTMLLRLSASQAHVDAPPVYATPPTWSHARRARDGEWHRDTSTSTSGNGETLVVRVGRAALVVWKTPCTQEGPYACGPSRVAVSTLDGVAMTPRSGAVEYDPRFGLDIATRGDTVTVYAGGHASRWVRDGGRYRCVRAWELALDDLRAVPWMYSLAALALLCAHRVGRRAREDRERDGALDEWEEGTVSAGVIAREGLPGLIVPEPLREHVGPVLYRVSTANAGAHYRAAESEALTEVLPTSRAWLLAAVDRAHDARVGWALAMASAAIALLLPLAMKGP